MRIIATLAAVLATAVAAIPAAVCAADDYPNKPVMLVVPFAAGGPTDVVGRLIGRGLEGRVRQPVVILNRPGAGNTGSASVAAAAPDGYTLVLGTVATHGINPSLYARMPYDHARARRI